MSAITEELAKSNGLKTVEDNGDGTGAMHVIVNSQTNSAVAAGENHIGEVGGNSAIITPALAVTAALYAAGNVVGGKLQIVGAMRKNNGTGRLQSICIKDNANQKPALEILLFSQNPATGTYTDKTAFTFDVADRPFLINRISVVAADYVTVGGVAVADVLVNGKLVKATNNLPDLYAVIVLPTASTPTFAATTDLTVNFGFLRD